jgi:hypothetical protein
VKATWLIATESTVADTDVCRRMVAVVCSPPEVLNEMAWPGAAESGQQYPSMGRTVDRNSCSAPVVGR